MGHKLSQPDTAVLDSVDATAGVVPRQPMTTSRATTILAPPTPSLTDQVLPQLDPSTFQLPSVSSSTKLIPSLSSSSQRHAPATVPYLVESQPLSTLPGSTTTALGNIL